MKLRLRDVCRALIACGVLAVASACGGREGGSTPTPPSTTASAPLPPVRFTVMTFNIQHGIDGQNKYNLRRAIDTIARIQPDLVALQEVTRNHPYYNCDDQPAMLAAGLNGQTAQSWDAAYQQEWFTLDASCQAGRRGDGPETEGLVWLTRRSMSRATMVALPNSRIGLHVALRDARDLPFIATHLTSGAAGAADRMQQIERLLSWSAGFGTPRIFVGDFNAATNTPEMQRALSVYHDAWTEGQRTGRAVGDGLSKGTSRVDYILYAGDTLTLESIEAVNTVALIGLEASDHRPVVATFTLR